MANNPSHQRSDRETGDLLEEKFRMQFGAIKKVAEQGLEIIYILATNHPAPFRVDKKPKPTIFFLKDKQQGERGIDGADGPAARPVM